MAKNTSRKEFTVELSFKVNYRGLSVKNGLKTLRNGQIRWTVGNFHALHDQRSETFTKHVHVSKVKETWHKYTNLNVFDQTEIYTMT